MNTIEIRNYLTDLVKKFEKENFLYDTSVSEFVSWAINSREWTNKIHFCIEDRAIKTLIECCNLVVK